MIDRLARRIQVHGRRNAVAFQLCQSTGLKGCICATLHSVRHQDTRINKRLTGGMGRESVDVWCSSSAL